MKYSKILKCRLNYFVHFIIKPFTLIILIHFRQCPEVEINRVAVRVLDEIVKPLSDLSLDANEFACLKAIVFFDPGKAISYYVLYI